MQQVIIFQFYCFLDKSTVTNWVVTGLTDCVCVCVCVCVVHQDLTKLQEQLSTKENEIKSLKKENRKRRKIIEAYQDMLNAGATGLHTV